MQHRRPPQSAPLAESSTIDRQPDISAWLPLLGAVVGLLAFSIIIGASILDGSNIAWMVDEDSKTHVLGWLFFREAPWTWPPGASPSYGEDISSAIAYSDSVPLMALTLKLFDFLLPQNIQFTGWWLALCFALQGYFGFRLVALIDSRWSVCLLGSAFFVLTPAFLFRTPSHYSLCAHWLILAALYVFLAPLQRKGLYFILLLAASTLVHIYLLAMVGAIWGAWLLATLIDEHALARVLTRFGLGLAVVLMSVWLAGYFTLRPTPDLTDVGGYPLNLLSPLDPGAQFPSKGDIPDSIAVWSTIMPDLPNYPGDYEGFNYLGLGVILLAALAVAALANPRARASIDGRHLAPLGLAVLLLAMFALSTKVVLGSQVVMELHLPELVSDGLAFLRSSGRMFWPAGYMILLAGIWGVAQVVPRRFVGSALALLLVLQVTDLRAGIHDLRKIAVGPTWSGVPDSPFWDCAGQSYRALHFLPGGSMRPGWNTLGLFAAHHGMTMNTGYWRDVDTAKLAQMQAALVDALLTGNFDPAVLYVLDDDSATLASGMRSEGDLLAKIDGWNVLAPGWNGLGCVTEATFESNPISPVIPTVETGRALSFAAGGAGVPLLGIGWSDPESWGVWSDSADALLVMGVPEVDRSELRLEFELEAFVAQGGPAQSVEVWLNGVQVSKMQFADDGWRQIAVEVPPEAWTRSPDMLLVRFVISNPTSPISLGLGQDPRRLGLGLRSLTLIRSSDVASPG